MFVENKVALVTGGVSGIGLTFTREFLKNGVRGLTIADINIQQGNIICDALNQEFGKGKVIFVETDVSDILQFEAAMKKTVETFKNFDILVNNAGILNEKLAAKEVSINLNGVINGCTLAMETYISKYKTLSEGLIVNIASIAGLDSIPTIPVYTATKHAVVGLSKSLSAKLHYDATKVKIITICPGFTDTPLFENLRDKFSNERCYEETMALLANSNLVMQSIADLGKAIIPIINQGENGTFWIVDGENVSSVHLQSLSELEKIQTLNST